MVTNLSRMKLRLFFTIAALACVTYGVSSCTSAKSYADYTASSGFMPDPSDARDAQVVENLDVLCRVWGYVKYHHPVFAGDKYNIDYELFELLPRIAHADKAARNRVLAAWIDALGSYKADKAKYDRLLAGRTCVTLPDLGWTADTARLGRELCGRLQSLRYADRAGNRYVSFGEAGNMQMTPDESIAGSLDDCGYRLLYLFRFWNLIEYYAPDRNITDRNWDEIPAAYIPQFICMSDRRPVWSLLHELCDSHGRAFYNEQFGNYALPVEVDYADGRVFVADAGSDCGLRRGDELLTVDGRDWKSVYGHVCRYTSVSNDAGARLFGAYALCLTTKDSVEVVFVRRGLQHSIRCAAPLYRGFSRLRHARMSDPGNVRIIADSVGYMTALNYRKNDAERLMKQFAATKALIVDLRCYPDEFMPIDFVGRYFLPHDTPHVKWVLPTRILPGTFRIEDDTLPAVPTPPSSENRDYYKGRVVVLVDGSTLSQPEYTAMAFQATPRCTVVGSQTAGADGDVSVIRLPGTDRLLFSGLGVFYPDGTDTQRTGVRIDIPVRITPEGLLAGRDEILEKALEIIRSGE